MLDGLISSFFKEGAIAFRLPGGRVVCAGCAHDHDAPIVMAIRDTRTALAILANPTLCVGEAYMEGGLTIERGTLYQFMDLVTRNLWHFRDKRPWLTTLRQKFARKNARSASRRNVARHYDLSGDLYRLFLDSDQQYSCAYFREPGMSLEEAQAAKKRHIAAKLLIEPGHRVLDIGSGWGGLALTLAEEHGAEVLGVTLSTEQLAEATRRAAQKGLHQRVGFKLQDYRDVRGQFDRIVSIGMFEHVGPANYQTYFDAVGRLLAPDGVGLVHTIGNFTGSYGNNAWIEKYIFPGGCIPALTQIVEAVERAGLMVTDVEVLRLHYAETLHAWSERFAAQREEARQLYDERFCRMWEFYLAGAEASFRVGSSVVFQIQVAKRISAVPIVRDYITEFDRGQRQDGARIAAE